MSEADESRDFARIVAQLQHDDPRFAPQPNARRRRRARVLLAIGVALCVSAVLLITLGGAKGAVLAFLPWIAGMIFVIRSRG
ncbi:MAG: DUF3040 domain-containing protein [Actinoplanes sp.]